MAAVKGSANAKDIHSEEKDMLSLPLVLVAKICISTGSTEDNDSLNAVCV